MMTTFVRWTGRIAAGLFILLLLAMLAVYLLSERALAKESHNPERALATPTPARLAEGGRMLRYYGCTGCHGDALTGQPFKMDPKVASLYAPNLVRLAARVDDATLDRAIRGGVGHDGRALLLMPSAAYQGLTDQDAAAMIAAIRKLPVAGEEGPQRRLGPLGRIGLALGQFKTQPELVAHYAANPIPDLGADKAKGRYLVQTICADCHATDLKGKEIMPGTVSTDLAIVGAYDLGQFTKLLREGVTPGNKPLTLMAGVAKEDTRHLTNGEIADIHAYLQAFANRP